MNIHGLVFVGSLAGKGQQLTGEIGRVSSRGDDLSRVGRDRFPVDQTPHQKIGVRHDRQQLVVEIVCDSAGELPDGLELIGLTEFAFKFRSFGLNLSANGDVTQQTLGSDDRPFVVMHESRCDLAPEGRSVLSDVLEFITGKLELPFFGQSEGVLK